jgi:hypothetical protein
MPPNGGIIAKSRKPQENLGSCRTMHPRAPFSLCSFWPYSLLFFFFRLLPPSSFPRWRHRPEMKCTFCISSMSCAVVAAAGTPVALHPPACLLACSCLLLYLAASAVGLSWRTAELMLGDATAAILSAGHVRGPNLPTLLCSACCARVHLVTCIVVDFDGCVNGWRHRSSTYVLPDMWRCQCFAALCGIHRTGLSPSKPCYECTLSSIHLLACRLISMPRARMETGLNHQRCMETERERKGTHQFRYRHCFLS